MTFVRKLVLVCLKHNILFILSQTHLRFQEQSCGCTVSFSDPTFQETSTSLHGSYANDNYITFPSCKLASVVHKLLRASLQKSSVPTYRRAWKPYEEFQLSIYNDSHVSLPIMPATLALFVSYLFDNKCASSTVNICFCPRVLPSPGA